jgi:hypothetical protein
MKESNLRTGKSGNPGLAGRCITNSANPPNITVQLFKSHSFELLVILSWPGKIPRLTSRAGNLYLRIRSTVFFSAEWRGKPAIAGLPRDYKPVLYGSGIRIRFFHLMFTSQKARKMHVLPLHQAVFSFSHSPHRSARPVRAVKLKLPPGSVSN